ncbi:MAG: DUF3750 domain-containing protein [Alphaproteobacteria bacterium]|nr:DUF3750 domain-containing protein [Alphaproteobacteria bacterium]
MRRWSRWLLVAVLLLAPLPVSLGVHGTAGSHWSQARRDSSGLAPNPASEPGPVVQVYSGRAWGWRRAFGVHTWIAAKPRNGDHYTRYEVLGWRARYGGDAVRVSTGTPDGYWYGARPTLLADIRGSRAERIIGQLGPAVAAYPARSHYRIWPGPNSNSFTAWLARTIDGLGVDLPPTAVGKDYLVGGGAMAPSPSGTGWQVSLGGLAGVLVGLDEGLEVSLLGLTWGIDFDPPALKLPGLGRLGMASIAP